MVFNKYRRSSAKRRKTEQVHLLEDHAGESSDGSTNTSRRRKSSTDKQRQKMYRPKAALSLWSLKEAIDLIENFKPPTRNEKHFIDNECQVITNKKIVQESVQNTLICVEDTTKLYAKEIVMQSLLKADFVTSIKVLCSMINTECVSLGTESVYFKKCAVLMFMYIDDSSHLYDFLQLVFKTKAIAELEEEELYELMKTYLKLKALRNNTTVLPLENGSALPVEYEDEASALPE
uniref:Uncharacterized protein n=1 Tax=Cacopsylla melanoneura TaxID=428564 RepID=A0A8D8SRA2_9HEMI